MRTVETLKSAVSKLESDKLVIPQRRSETSIATAAQDVGATVDHGNYYEVLGLKTDANDQQIHQAWLKARNPNADPSDAAQKQIDVAYRVLSNAGDKSLYDNRLKFQTDVKKRFKVIVPSREYTAEQNHVCFVQGVGFTDDPAIAQFFASNGHTVEDQRPGTPGGLGCETLERFKIEIPAGRKFTGKTFVDRYGLSFKDGVAYTSLVDSLRSAKELSYTITDRAAT